MLEVMNTTRKEYEYKQKWTIVFFGGGFFGLGVALFVYLAITNDGGLTLNSINLLTCPRYLYHSLC